jgi:hypothetical protein
MSDLAEFLLARIAEDEEVARSGAERTYPGFESWKLHNQLNTYAFGQPAPVIASRARVLAECEAKRRIVAWHRLIDGLDNEDRPVRGCCNCIASGAEPPYLIAGPCMTLRLLALPYADHDDYDLGWRP